MAGGAGAAHPVGGGCTVHVAAVSQQAVRRVHHRVLVHRCCHRGRTAADCTQREKNKLFLSRGKGFTIKSPSVRMHHGPNI
jgi:hypothetical protein